MSNFLKEVARARPGDAILDTRLGKAALAVLEKEQANKARAPKAPKATPPSTAMEVFKESEEERYTLGIAYSANRPDPHRGADGHRDFISAAALRRGAYSYIRKGARVGLDHAQDTAGAGTVMESYLWPEGAPDWETPTGYVVKANDWLLGVVWEPEAWKSIKSRKRTGYSIQGGATRRIPTRETLAQLRSN